MCPFYISFRPNVYFSDLFYILKIEQYRSYACKIITRKTKRTIAYYRQVNFYIKLMSGTITPLPAIRYILAFILLSFSAKAQIKITSPVSRTVYQREISGKSTFTVTGTYGQPVDKVEIRAIPVEAGQGIETPWTVLQNNPSGGIFYGNYTLQSGWYSLEVRASFKSGEYIRDVVSRMGIGEVFIIAGQSNAQGLRNQGAPSATDDRVNYLVYDNTVNTLEDPPTPQFEHLEGNSDIGPRGQSAWCWGVLGDKLAKKLNVPVLFINTAWEGTSMINWSESAAGKITYNAYGGFDYPSGMPYANLSISARHYASRFGVRSILWTNGETDNYPLRTNKTTYQEQFQTLINLFSSQTGKRITFVISRTSRTSPDYTTANSMTSQEVIDGQNAILAVPFNPVYPGPETDNLVLDREDGVHFKGESALRVLAEAWDNSLSTTFFATVTPVTPALSPAMSVSCGADNSSLTLTLPDGYSSYSWSSGQTGKSITVTSPNTYRATLKDANGNAVYSPALVVTGSVKPATPTVVPGDCPPDKGFLLTATGGNHLFTWTYSGGAVTSGLPAFRVEKKGTYTIKAQNVYGCSSENSAPITIPFDAPIKTTVTPAGPFSLMASISSSGSNERYDWKSGSLDLSIHDAIVRVVEKGSYSARATANYVVGNSTVTCISAYSEPTSYATSDADAIVIFPNPIMDDKINIECRENLTNTTVSLYKSNGVLLSTKDEGTVTNRITIDTRNFPSGIYIVKVVADGVDITKKVIVY